MLFNSLVTYHDSNVTMIHYTKLNTINNYTYFFILFIQKRIFPIFLFEFFISVHQIQLKVLCLLFFGLWLKSENE